MNKNKIMINFIEQIIRLKRIISVNKQNKNKKNFELYKIFTR
jgi:hypothetical protein